MYKQLDRIPNVNNFYAEENMVTFNVSSIRIKEWHNDCWFRWMYEHIGHGGLWLRNLCGEIEAEQGDDWGYYFTDLGAYKVAIQDEGKAMLFSLRWL